MYWTNVLRFFFHMKKVQIPITRLKRGNLAVLNIFDIF